MANGETYEEFVDKFKPKLTTDDCYTPKEVFEVMKKYCYEIGWMNDKTSFIRPFYPGEEKTNYDPDYMTGAVLQSLTRSGKYIASYDSKSFKRKTNEGKTYFGGAVEVKILTQNKL